MAAATTPTKHCKQAIGSDGAPSEAPVERFAATGRDVRPAFRVDVERKRVIKPLTRCIAQAHEHGVFCNTAWDCANEEATRTDETVADEKVHASKRL